MKKLAFITTALTMLVSPVLAQPVSVRSNSASGAISQSGVNWNGGTTINKGNTIPGAGSVVGGVSASQFNCDSTFGIAAPYAGLAIPVESTTCAPVVAAMAYLQCGNNRTCKAILSQNKYARQGMIITGEVVEPGSIAAATAAAYANTSPPSVVPVRAKAASGHFCDNPQSYNPTLCAGR